MSQPATGAKRRRGDGGRGAPLEGIRCPSCGWVPHANDRLWACTCGHVWNTFETRAKCPACNKEWKETACPNCHEWSSDTSWYEPSRQEADDD